MDNFYERLTVRIDHVYEDGREAPAAMIATRAGLLDELKDPGAHLAAMAAEARRRCTAMAEKRAAEQAQELG